MASSGHRVEFAGRTLDRSRHICAFFNSAEEEYRVLMPFIREGIERTRVVAHMEWGLEQRAGADDLLEYEARFNLRIRNRDPVVCTYDLNLYSAAFIVDVMRTHPMMLAGGILQENPFYVQPEEFIRELQDRKARKIAAGA